MKAGDRVTIICEHVPGVPHLKTRGLPGKILRYVDDGNITVEYFDASEGSKENFFFSASDLVIGDWHPPMTEPDFSLQELETAVEVMEGLNG